PASDSITVPITVTALHGAAGPIQLSAVGLPPQITATFTPGTLQNSGASLLRLQGHGAAVATDAKVTVIATAATAVHAASATYTVVPQPGCTTGAGPLAWLAVAGWAFLRRKRRR